VALLANPVHFVVNVVVTVWQDSSIVGFRRYHEGSVIEAAGR
jgi:hypothetical protein